MPSKREQSLNTEYRRVLRAPLEPLILEFLGGVARGLDLTGLETVEPA